MKIYKPYNKIIRITITDNSYNRENIIKFSLVECEFKEVIEMIENIFEEYILDQSIKSRAIGKLRSAKINIDELNSSDIKLKKVSRTISLQNISALAIYNFIIENI